MEHNNIFAYKYSIISDYHREKCLFYTLNLLFYYVKTVFMFSKFLFSTLLAKIFSKALLVSIFLFYTFDLQALSAISTNLIYGSPPYLTFDDGKTKVTSTEELLTITLSDGRKITPETDNSTWENPIQLPSADKTLADIHINVPASETGAHGYFDAPLLSFDELAKSGNLRDDDGDEPIIVSSGGIKISIENIYPEKVNRYTAPLDICAAPYKITLSGYPGSISTLYGLPNRSDFDFDSHTFSFAPKHPPKLCFLQPRLYVGGMDSADRVAPINIYRQFWGFLPQSTEPELYSHNWPTTGMDKLYFTLQIGGIDGTTLTWPSVTHDGITAKMTFDDGLVKVTLNGPEASNQVYNDRVRGIHVPKLPQTFEIIGYDNSGNAVIKYGFVLRQWFVHRGYNSTNYSSHKNWCQRLGYRVAQIKDITNSNCKVEQSEAPECQGGLPAAPVNFYQRNIGASLMAEWGDVSSYGLPLSYQPGIIASDYDGRFLINNNGKVEYSSTGFRFSNAICVTP